MAGRLTRLMVRRLAIGIHWSAPILAILLALGTTHVPCRGETHEQQIDRLIEELGSKQYVLRTQAKKQLQELGLDAFDALFAAKKNKDVEIRMTARYLLGRINFNWASINDSPEIQGILRGYDKRNASDRKNRIIRMSEIEGDGSVQALCRVARFEKTELLSKYAALMVIVRPRPVEFADRLNLSQIVDNAMGKSNRTSSDWLRTYAQTLIDPKQTVEIWETLSANEIELHESLLNHDRTSRDLVGGLIRWRADLLLEVGLREAAEDAMYDFLELVDTSQPQIVDAVDWLIQRQAWTVIEAVEGKFPRSFESDGLLLYRIAEALFRQGKSQEAEQTAKRASSLLPEDPQGHIEAALRMHDRGFLKWAENEYERAIDIAKSGSLPELEARFLLAEMLHDLQRDLKAAEVVKAIVDGMEADESIAQNVGNAHRRPADVRSQMHFYYALHYRSKSDTAKEMEHLTLGNESFPLDPDIVIAMFHVQNAPEDWKQAAHQRVEAAVGQFREEINELERLVSEADSERLRAQLNQQLGQSCNQLAWLVANTTGDFEEAIRYSHRSLELRPESSSYLDTLGRCYFANKDYRNAVKFQKQAVELDPHSRLLKKQLKEFREALANSKE